MKKRVCSIAATLCMVISMLATPALAEEQLTATPSATNAVMNGAIVSVDQAYALSGNNYLQVRAIAALLSGTVSQFNVGWDGTYVVIETGVPYEGAVTAATPAATTNVRKSSTSFRIDGTVVTLEKVYLIGGDTNYVQFREFAEKLKGTNAQFNLYWDNEQGQIVIEPGKPYTGVKPGPVKPIINSADTFSFADDGTGAGVTLQFYNSFATASTDKMPTSYEEALAMAQGGKSPVVTVPESYDGKPVTAISEGAFANLTFIETVNLPQSIKRIGAGAFSGCTGLTSVTLPDGLLSLGDSAFAGTAITSVTVPGGVTAIGQAAFAGCKALTSVTLPGGLQRIGAAAFSDCAALGGMDIPDSVTELGMSVFMNCTSLTRVKLPATLAAIPNNAFYGCAALTDITVPSTVQAIGAAAFKDCRQITAINIPNGIKAVESQTFSGCVSLKAALLPGSVTKIGSGAFKNCAALGSMELPDDISQIGEEAFYGCASLRSLAFPAAVARLEKNTIGQCTSLTQVTVLSTARDGLYVGDGNYGLGVERGKYTRTAQQAKDGEKFVRSSF